MNIDARKIKFAAGFFIIVALLLVLGANVQKTFATTFSVGHWKLDETTGTTVADSSANLYTGTNHNATSSTDVPSAITFSDPRSLSFTSASSSYVDLPSSGVVGSGAAWSMCGWFKTTSTAAETIYGEASTNIGSSDKGLVTMDINASAPGLVRLFIRNDSAATQISVSSASAKNDGLWHFTCGVKNSDGDYRLYVDGGQYNSTSTLGSVPTLTKRAIGALERNTNTNYWTGNIDDVRVYDRALSGTEISNLYAGNEIDTVVTAPTAPQNLVVVPEDSQASLMWSAPSSNGGALVTDYLVEYKATATSTWTTFTDGVSTTTAALVTGLTDATSYDFRVSAINSIGTSSPTSTASATPVSSGTLLLSDNFNTNTIDPAKWIETDSASGGSGAGVGNIQIQNGQAVIQNVSNWNTNLLRTVSSYDRSASNLTIQADVTYDSCSASPNGGIFYGPYTNGFLSNGTLLFNLSTLYTLQAYGGSSVTASTSCSNSVPVNIRMIVKSSGGVDVYLNGATTTPSARLNTALAPASFTNYPILIQAGKAPGSAVRFDNIQISGTATATTTASSTISSVVATPQNQSALIQWNQVLNATDYQIEYKPTVSPTWTVFPDPVSTARGVTVTGLTNNTSYDFRVSAVISGATSTPSVATSTTPIANPITSFYHHILSTGQSLSIGVNATNTLTMVQPYNNKMLNSGNLALIPLVEPSTYADGAESMSSALGNMISSLTGNNYDSIITLNGVGSTPYTGLEKGTTPYANGIAEISSAMDLSIAAGKPYNVPAVTVVHGETDESIGTSASQYEADLVQWQSNYQTDIKAITGQLNSIPLFTDQVSSWTGYNHATPTTAIGQLNAAIDNPNSIYLVTPMYIFDYNGDHAHLVSWGYRRLGEYFAKVMKQVLVDGQDWKPLMPTSITRTDNIVTVKFHVPVAPLQFDTTAVDAVSNYGFEYADDSSSASISSVQITASDTVQITLSQVPTGGNQILRYAYTGVPGAAPGAHSVGSAKGNLRDSDNTAALYQDSNVPTWAGNYLHNWAVTFSDPIVTNTSTSNNTPSVSYGGGGGGFSGGSSPVTTQVSSSGSPLSTTASVSSFTRNLTVGSRGSDVSDLQKVLIAKGYLSSDSDTGYFGSLTKAALAKYQAVIGISPAVGYFGPITISTLSSTQSTTPNTTPNTSDTTLNAFTQDLSLGAKSSQVQLLQEYLNKHGYVVSYSGNGSVGSETTYFGSATKAALISFQKASGITPASGYFGSLTRAYINSH